MDEFASSSGARLFLAAVPDAGTAERIHRLAGVLKCRRIGRELRAFLGGRGGWTQGYEERGREEARAASSIRAAHGRRRAPSAEAGIAGRRRRGDGLS